MKHLIRFIFIFALFFLTRQIFAFTSLDSSKGTQTATYGDNTQDWHNRNDHLIPDEKETAAILSLNQKRDFGSDDIDGDGVVNTADPSPYDWREIGYQPFGVLAFLPWRHDWNNYKYSDRDLKKVVKLLKEAGVAFVRMDFLWEDIEPTKDKLNFDKYDFIIGLLSKEDIRILGIFGYSASWAAAQWNSPSENLEDFTNFISSVILRYKDKIKYWEIWNEPDSNTYWQPQDDMKTYTKLLRLSYLAAKKADPSCKVVLGGMTSSGYYAIKEIYRNGGRDFFDIINIHPFVNPLLPAEYKRINVIYNNLEKLKVQYNDQDKKIWFTELGCPGVKPKVKSRGWWMGESPSEKEQAEFLSFIYTDVIKLANVEKVFWAFFRDNKDHFKNDVDYFGLIRWNFSKKPAFAAFKKKAIRWLSSHTYLK